MDEWIWSAIVARCQSAFGGLDQRRSKRHSRRCDCRIVTKQVHQSHLGEMKAQGFCCLSDNDTFGFKIKLYAFLPPT